MMKTTAVCFLVLSVTAAPLSAQNPPIESTTQGTITAEMIGRRFGAMTLKRAATDPDYAFSEAHPVMVKGGLGEGSHNVYRFLNALRGPAGQQVQYSRVGSCCAFKTKKSPFGGDLLDVYEVSYDGYAPRRMYFNWYDDGEILIPVGFSAAK